MIAYFASFYDNFTRNRKVFLGFTGLKMFKLGLLLLKKAKDTHLEDPYLSRKDRVFLKVDFYGLFSVFCFVFDF